jgi:hypothetical protein
VILSSTIAFLVRRPLIFGIAVTAFLCFVGWGYWGFGFNGDYTVEFSDALRIHQGSVAYKNFIPTYGILYSCLMSGLFCFGQHSVAAIFLAAFLLILIQFIALTRMGLVRGGFQQTVFVLLYLGLAAFSLTDSNFMIGFSQSTLIAGVLFALMLLLLNKPITWERGIICGFLLGLQWFTKLDMTVPSLTILFILLLTARTASVRWSLVTSYLATLGLVVLLILASGGQWTLFVESMTELLIAAPTLAPDTVLRYRMIAVAMAIGIAFLLLTFFRFSRFKRTLLVLWLGLFPLIGIMDALRGGHDLRKELVLTKWYLYCTVTWICMRFLWILIRRGWRVFHRRRVLQGICVLILCFFGFARAFLSGWYPLGYTMPFILLLIVASIPRSIGISEKVFFRGLQVAWLGIALLFVGRAAVRYQTASDVGTFSSPYGSLLVRGEFYRSFSPFKDAGIRNEKITRTFSTYPFISIIHGAASVNLHSVLFRLQWANPYDPQEMRVLQFLQDGSPELVLLENTASETKALFGSDYGCKIFEYIERNYEPVASSGEGFNPKSRREGGTLYRKKSLSIPSLEKVGDPR